ncbi:Dothistromin biosynthesis peroxidase dotB [Pseudocercospora fuligena]|uniref:Dothistromin biosynthesis peroxidase dotB n=1 Tax=Pseudocercospora fuligena TaxID=685502 RepID=A0A8H6RG85_9PEZI|nr:Dothistromin biosynthesis peroxidase dotB [Pseudocercospora fuligena]
MKFSALTAGVFATQAAAFPFVMMDDLVKAHMAKNGLEKRQTLPPAGSDAAKAASRARTNCGAQGPCLVFNKAEQYVSTSGTHAFKSPGPSDIRGTCPGLNAAANHGYLNRNGVQGIVNTITGLGAAYGMSVDLAGFLAAYAVVFNGDPILQQWSIGGPPPTLFPSLLGRPQGIDYSHNNYEGDVSIGRADAYLNNGDAYSLQIDRFREAYEYQTPNPRNGKPKIGSDRYDLDSFAQNFDLKLNQSVANNPYFFSAPFSGLVAPAAYNFVINFMSNHSETEKSGYLDGSQFKQFFSVTGDYPNFKWNPGQERIPENWYRRTSTNQYTAVSVFQDLIPQFIAYPNSFRFGGNTGTTNSFVGFDFGDLTGGVFDNQQQLLQGNNLQCFFAQAATAIVPDAISNGALLQAINGITGKYFAALTGGITCPPLKQLNNDLFSKYPGASYTPKP